MDIFSNNVGSTVNAVLGNFVRNPASAVNAYGDVRSVGFATMLTPSMAAVAIGGPGNISAAANDTHLMRLIVGTATLGGAVTFDGFQDIAGNAVQLTFASTTPQGVYELGHILNDKGQLKVTTGLITAASVMVVTRPA